MPVRRDCYAKPAHEGGDDLGRVYQYEVEVSPACCEETPVSAVPSCTVSSELRWAVRSLDTWTGTAVRELEVELRRLDLDAETKRTDAERAQAEYDAVLTQQVTVRRMLEWARKKQAQQVEEPTLPEDSPVLEAELVSPPQTDLCIRALMQIGRPATTAEIRERLQRAGYQYDQTQLRSAMKYLSRKKIPQSRQSDPVRGGFAARKRSSP